MAAENIQKKILVSVGFGLIGFTLNFHAVHFAQFVEFKASILFGLLFPLLIALAWGWKFGLLSALAGGSQSMWWLWRSDGFGILYAVPVFTLWIVWHGVWSDYRKKVGADIQWYHSMYVVELGFRLFSESGFYTVFRWLVAFNPPPWRPDISWTFVPYSWVNFVVIKHLVTAYILMLAAHVLLSMGPVRRFFMLPPKPGQASTTYVVSAFLLLGVFLWVLDSVVVYYAFTDKKDSLLAAVTTHISPRDLFVRNFFLLVCFVSGLLVSRFLSERYEKEESLKISEIRFRSLFENLYDGVAVYRAESDGADFIFVDMNDSGQRLSKVKKEDIVGRHITDIFPAVREMGLFDAIQRVYRTGETEKLPMTLYKDQRISEWVDNTVFRLPSNEIVAVYRDESERHIAEEKVRKLNEELEKRVAERTKQLEETHEELEDFVYSVSHDLRAPLRAISGFSEIIARRHLGTLNEEGRHYFSNILKAGAQMGDLIDDLLQFSRMGRKSLKTESLNPENTIRAAMAALDDQIREKGAEIVFSEGMPAIKGDSTLLHQIVANLLDNALKYAKPDVPPLVEISCIEKGVYAHFSVSDNGIGIDPVYHEKIFKIFQRLHHQSEYPGTGIGLAAVRKAAQMMGGKITVESELGKGSVFTVELNRA